MMELPVTRMSRIVMPASTNDAGNLYGGRRLTGWTKYPELQQSALHIRKL